MKHKYEFVADDPPRKRRYKHGVSTPLDKAPKARLPAMRWDGTPGDRRTENVESF
jgi:hypothetical protein